MEPCIRLWVLRILARLDGHRQFYDGSSFYNDQLAEELGFGHWLDEEEEDGNEKSNAKAVLAELKELLRQAEKDEKTVVFPEILRANIERLSELVGLSEVERRILAFAILLHNESVLNDVSNWMGELSTTKMFHVVSVILGLPDKAVRNALEDHGALIASGLISVDHDSCSLTSKLDPLSREFFGRMLFTGADPVSLLRGMVSVVPPGHLHTEDYAHIQDSLQSLQLYQWSQEVFQHLEEHGYINDGKATSQFLPDSVGFSLHLPEKFKPYENDIIGLVNRASIEKYVKPKSKRQARKLNKELYAVPEFVAFWNTISQKTVYRVSVKRDDIIPKAIAAIEQAEKIQPLRIEVTRAGVRVLRGGTVSDVKGSRIADLKGSYDLPDIIRELQQDTSLTRKTLVDILVGCGKLNEFIGNPNDFIAMTRQALKSELAKIVVEGIQYEKIDGSLYELRELQADGEEEKERFLDQMYQVQNKQKTDFDYVVYDSDVECEFAGLLDSREDIKLFMKLPAKFKVSTPVGSYNPDWAIIKQENGEDRIYMIRETKSTQDDTKLRPSELAKIKSAKRHFEAIGVSDYKRSTPGKWNL
ncbi:hypothetical protein AGMMS50256_03040 [Betaproteobacteria bacterium]|nr:hypothetical protein AGMMS50256_03040 [Betaproteobacteria bacterium]